MRKISRLVLGALACVALLSTAGAAESRSAPSRVSGSASAAPIPTEIEWP